MAKGGRTFFFGLKAEQVPDGKSPIHATIKIRPQNAYEYLGLRRPSGGQLGKA